MTFSGRTGLRTASSWRSSGRSRARNSSSTRSERSCIGRRDGSRVCVFPPAAIWSRFWTIRLAGTTAERSPSSTRPARSGPWGDPSRPATAWPGAPPATKSGTRRRKSAATAPSTPRVLAARSARSTGSRAISPCRTSHADGRVLVTQDVERLGNLGRGPGQEKEVELTWLDWSLANDLSPDGSTLLFTESGEGGGPGYSAYTRSTDGAPAVRLGEGSAQSLSPDGKSAAGLLGISSGSPASSSTRSGRANRRRFRAKASTYKAWRGCRTARGC